MEAYPRGYNVCCFTKLSEYKDCEWPDIMAIIPRVGDYIEERVGGKRLIVIAVIFQFGARVTIELGKKIKDKTDPD